MHLHYMGKRGKKRINRYINKYNSAPHNNYKWSLPQKILFRQKLYDHEIGTEQLHLFLVQIYSF